MGSTDLISIPLSLCLLKCHKNGIIQYVAFCVDFFHIAFFMLIPFYLLINSWAAFHWLEALQFVNSFTGNGHLDCVQFLMIMIKITITTHVQVLVWHVFSFLLHKHLGVTLVSHKYVCCVCFIFIRNCQTVVQSGCYFAPQAMSERSSCSPSSSAALTDVWWNPIVVFVFP